jgi:hypothetical protein
MTGTQEPWRGRQQATSGEAPTNEPIDLDQANAGLNPTRNDIGLASGETALDKPHSFRDDTKRDRSALDTALGIGHLARRPLISHHHLVSGDLAVQPESLPAGIEAERQLPRGLRQRQQASHRRPVLVHVAQLQHERENQ